MSWAIVGGSLLSIGGGLFGMGAAKRKAREAADEKRKQQRELKRLENSRQTIINPYIGTKNLSSMASDLSGAVSNPFANLGVATQAAEMQIEQSDIALANTLDTLRSTGASAGGATALAQAALQSKKGVSASIENQEAQNEKLKAQGEQKMEMIKMQEQQRIQGINISESQRIQQADAAGKKFEFSTRENRQVAQLNRVAGLADRAANQEAQANSDRTAAFSGMVSGLSSIAGAGISANATKKAGMYSNPNYDGPFPS